MAHMVLSWKQLANTPRSLDPAGLTGAPPIIASLPPAPTPDESTPILPRRKTQLHRNLSGIPEDSDEDNPDRPRPTGRFNKTVVIERVLRFPEVVREKWRGYVGQDGLDWGDVRRAVNDVVCLCSGIGTSGL